MKKTLYLATGLVALSIFTSCSVDMPKTKEKAVKNEKTETVDEVETAVEEEGVIQAGTPEKVPVDRTEMLSFWREFKQLVSFKDSTELRTMFSEDYDGIMSGLYKLDYYQKHIAASSHEDVKETKEIHKGNVVYEIMFTFPPEFPEEGQEESATTIYMQKNKAGNFEIFSVIEAG